MKKYVYSLLSILLVTLTLLPLNLTTGTVSEAQAAAVKSVDDFKDLKDLPQELKVKFDLMIREGVFNGLSADNFGLNDLMNRAQFAKVAAIIFKLSVDQSLTSSTFTDVSIKDKSNSYALPYIEALKKAGLTKGYDAAGKTYKPSGLVSRQELATFLIRGLGLENAAKQKAPVADATVDSWAKSYVALALEKNLMTNENDGKFGGAKSATRKMLVLASYEAKKLFEGTGSSTPKPAATPTPKPAATATPTPKPSTGEISAQGKKILFVRNISTIRSNDIFIGDRMKALGFRVTYMTETLFTAAKTAGYDLIFISNTVNSKYLKGGVMKDIAIPTLYAKNHGMYYLGLSSIEENANVLGLKSIGIVDTKHKVVAGTSGTSGTLDVYKEADPKVAYSYGIMGKEAKVIATVPGNKSKGTIYYYDKGTKADNGYAVKARISFIYYNGDYENGTDDGWKIIDNMVLWTLQNG